MLGRFSILDYADYLEETIADLGLSQPPVLVGHSMGGILAQILATRIPVAGIALLAPVPPAGIHVVRPINLLATAHVMLRWGFWRRPQMPSPAMARFGLFHRLGPAHAREAVAEMVPESGRAYAEIVFWFLDRRRATEVPAEEVRCPVLVLTGGRDRVLPPGLVRRVAARYPQASFRVFPRLGHWLFEEPGSDQLRTELVSWVGALDAGQVPIADYRVPAPAQEPPPLSPVLLEPKGRRIESPAKLGRWSVRPPRSSSPS